MGRLYLEIEGQSCLVGNVGQGLMENRQIDLLDRMMKKRARKKQLVIFPHSYVSWNLSVNSKLFGQTIGFPLSSV